MSISRAAAPVWATAHLLCMQGSSGADTLVFASVTSKNNE